MLHSDSGSMSTEEEEDWRGRYQAIIIEQTLTPDTFKILG